jgi:hypothetical protein
MRKMAKQANKKMEEFAKQASLTMDIPLTYKQSLFVANYIQTGGNGRASARAAGYKGNTATLGAVASS